MSLGSISLQDKYAPNNKCFGCGPKNDKGLRIKSFVRQDKNNSSFCVSYFNPESHHQAFEGMLNGGICGAILDCHSNWTAAHYLMQQNSLEIPPCTVTAKFSVELLAPTPMDQELEIKAWVLEEKSNNRKAVIKAEIIYNYKNKPIITATCNGLFVAVKEGHPAYHRW